MKPILVATLILTALAASGQCIMMMGNDIQDTMLMRYAMMKV